MNALGFGIGILAIHNGVRDSVMVIGRMRGNYFKWTFPSRCKFYAGACGIIEPNKSTGGIGFEFSLSVVVGLLGCARFFLRLSHLVKCGGETGLKRCGIGVRR